MNEGFEREEQLFSDALAIADAAGRAAFLRQACGEDTALRERIERLLGAMGRAGEYFDQVEQADTGVAPPLEGGEQVGDRIGPYTLLEQIGEGGFGAVYAAEQEAPVRRRVAIKIIKLGMDTRQVIARFEAERQALALMEHPHIAKVLDAGATDSGRPYFVMELIRGIPITYFCDERRLTIRQRLELFIPVCQAIQHAHQKGVIHRDIKPTNILVTEIDGRPAPVVIDFGVAKAIEQRLTERTLYTRFAQMIGTPSYMSPEQAELGKGNIDTRSDVYALGILLYELLTGMTPFSEERLREAGYAEIARIIREEEPLRPSTAVRTTGERRRRPTDADRERAAASLARVIRGDLDWIVMRAIEKEPPRRYPTANALAADVRRYLSHDPIEARPPSALYRLGRFARRHRVVAASGAAVVIVLAVATVVSLRLAIVADASARQAAQSERRTRRVLYASDMLLAQQALEHSDFGRASGLLDRHRPSSKSEPDLRGWEWRYLWAQCQSAERETLFQGSNAVTALAISADGAQLVVRRDPGLVMLWDNRTQRILAEEPASPWFKPLAASPAGQLLAWGVREADGAMSVKLWDSESQQEVARLPHDEGVVSVAFSPDAQWLATMTLRAEVSVWNVASRQVAATFQAQTRNGLFFGGSHYGCLSFSPTSRLLAIGTRAKRVVLLDWVSGTTQDLDLSSPADGVPAMAFAPDGKILALGGGYLDNTIHLYELETGRWSRLEGHAGWIVGLAFAPDGQLLASASNDQTLRLWDVSRGAEVKRFRGHQNEVYAVAWTPDGRQLFSGSKDGSVRSWNPAADLEDAAQIVLPARLRDLDFIPGTNRLVTQGWNENSVVVSDPATLRELYRLTSTRSNWFRLALSGDGRRLALGGFEGNVELWDLEARQRLPNLAVGNGWIWQLQFTRTGDRLLCVGEDAERRAERLRLIQFHEVPSGNGIDLPKVSLEDPSGAILSPDGRTLAVAHRGGTVTWWDMQAGQRTARFQWQHLGPEIQMAYSPDGRWFAAGGEKSVLMLVEVASQQTRSVARAHLAQVIDLAFSPDSRRLITTGTSGSDTIKIWDVESARDIAMLAGKPGFYSEIGFSHDGHTLFAVGNDGTALLWRAPSFAEIAAREPAQRSP
ncbi:MAG: hypothetical protein FJ387_23000 [Verrucomicrobia bacterium]|nr:hypothetical protein [Verrucomicrobiota bacterium]